MKTPTDVIGLMRPAEFLRATGLFKTMHALRYHLKSRRSNGMLDAGAVVETPLGMLIDPQKFRGWLTGHWPSLDNELPFIRDLAHCGAPPDKIAELTGRNLSEIQRVLATMPQVIE